MATDVEILLEREPATVAEATDGTDPSRCRVVVLVLGALALAAVAAFMTLDAKGSWSFVLELRGKKVASMVLVGTAVGCSTVLFQTVTGNRILTPSIMGFDALYILIQTLVVYLLGSVALVRLDPRAMFGVEVCLMVAFAGVLHRWLFGRHERDLYVLVLVGIVFGTMFGSITALVSRLIDPNEFLTLQDRFFASFNSVDEELLGIATALVLLALVAGWRLTRQLDVVALGRDSAVSLGVEHRSIVSRALVVVAVLVSVSTALVGPITFFGLLVAHLAYQALGTFRHRWTLLTAALLGVVALVGGQLVLERVFQLDTTLSIIINFVGGVYFIAVLVREARP